MEQTLEGVITKTFKVTDTGWMSGVLNTNKDSVRIAGVLNEPPVIGVNYILYGKMESSSKWGDQFKFTHGKSSEDKSGSNYIKSFLSSGFVKGIGSQTANLIVDKFGDNTLKIIKETPERLLEVKGISKKKLEKIVESYEKNNAFSDFYSLTNGKITPAMARRIYNVYGDKSAKQLSVNPYEFIETVDGIGFSRADSMALSVGFDEKSAFRMRAIINYILLDAAQTDGHLYLKLEDIQNKALSLISAFDMDLDNKKLEGEIEKYILENLSNNVDLSKFGLTTNQEDKIIKWKEKCEEYITLLADALIFNIDKGDIIVEDDRIYYKYLYTAENDTAKLISDLCKKSPMKIFLEKEIDMGIEKFEKLNSMKFNAEQHAAIVNSLSNNLSVITGGPGRGKTETIKAICSFWNPNDIILCAPTGKAAQKMREATNNESATTIHKTIYSFNEGKMELIKEQKDKLIIVDEVSMLDMNLAHDLLLYSKDCQIVLVGDKDQLPSIGAGSFFRDLLKCNYIPKVTLYQSFRYFGSIAYNCTEINKGHGLKYFKLDNDFVFKHTESNTIINDVVSSYMSLYNNGVSKKDICVLCPMKKGQYGSNEINSQIRKQIISSNTPSFEGYYLGDRVMVTRNNYHIETIKENVVSAGIFNGDIGEIVQINKEDESIKILFDDGRQTVLDKSNMDILELAYAMTIHKSQGSEYKHIIIPLITSYFIMLQRNLLYTGVSRAKKSVLILGQDKAIGISVRTQKELERNSMFLQKLYNYSV